MSDFDSLKKIIGDEKFEKDMDNIMLQVYLRISGSLTEQDMREIKLLDQKDETGDLTEYFLLSKIPNLYGILKEVIEEYKKSLTISKSYRK